ncbi:MAG: dihydropteroate synthase [Bacteroidia bacterium]
MQDSVFRSEYTVNCNDKLLDLSTPKVMGVLNLTPDSFFDGGKFMEEKKMLGQVEKMLNEGAAIIDVGAVSTRPGSKPVSIKTEIERLIPAMKTLVKKFPTAVFSADTFRSIVAVKAIEAGAAIVNDISGGEMDKKMFQTVGELKVPYILMHMKGTPQTMQKKPVYKDVVKELIDFFQKRIFQLRKAGVHDIIIDPGFGFGKTTKHNYEILRNLSLFKMLDCPVLVGISRKSMINKVLKTIPENALNGTTVLNTIALVNGAKILRVHDVKEAVEAVTLFTQYSQE